MKVGTKLFLSFLAASLLAAALSAGLAFQFRSGEIRYQEYFARAADALGSLSLELMAGYSGRREEKKDQLARRYAGLCHCEVFWQTPVAVSDALLLAPGARLEKNFRHFQLHLQPDPQIAEELVFIWRTPDHRGEHKWFFVALGLGFALVIMLYPVSRLLSQPLREMKDTVQALADGDLSRRVRSVRQDELGELGHAVNKMADRIKELLDSAVELNAHVSHELRSPLARMRLALELLEQKDGTSPYYGTLKSEIEHLDALIGRILLLSRLETKPLMHAGRVALHDLIREEADRLPAGGLDLRLQEVWIAADSVLVRSLVRNLLENASRFRQGQSPVTVVLESQEVALEVRNVAAQAGPGLERPFVRGDNATDEGSGLGLALVERIARLHGWRWRYGEESGFFTVRVWFSPLPP
ncbi:MAG: HAMP domain-containing histidine kinase [Spirochaetales bacterium]|nr:HAMP domain-containing histidine kinase [Spirochaetales bacterium]